MENEEKKLAEEKNPVNEKKKGIANAVKAIGGRIVDVFRDYPVTMIAIMLAALIFAILVEWNDQDSIINLERTAAFFLITAVQSLFFEEFFKKKWVVRGAGYGISAIISIAYVAILSSQKETLFNAGVDVVSEITVKILAVHGVILVGLAIRHMFRRLEEDFEVYATKAFLELLKATVIYALFAGGLATIILIFNSLIFDTDDFLAQVEIFLASGIYVPMCLKAISGKNEEPGKFFRVCIRYALLPMLLIAFGIIYLYIAKVFITNDVPSNKIFFILACLFTVGMPIWTAVHGLRKSEDFLSKAATFLPYAFLPFVCLQCWAMGLRVSAYGITYGRYFGMVLILCEIIYFVLYFLHHRGQKQAISWMLFVLMAMSFLTLLCPGTSYEDVTIHSQMSRLTKMLEDPNLSQSQQSSVKSAYRQIRYAGYKGKQALNEKLTAEQKELIESFDEYGYLTSEIIYVNDYNNEDGMEVAGYSYIYNISASDVKNLSDGMLCFHYTNYGQKTNSDPITVDLSELLNYAMSFTDRSRSDFSLKGRQKYVIDENRAIWLTNYSMEYNSGTKEILSLRVSGYLMEK